MFAKPPLVGGFLLLPALSALFKISIQLKRVFNTRVENIVEKRDLTLVTSC